MKILTVSPAQFNDTDVLAPEDLNRLWLYAKDALADVAQKRWARSALTFPFVVDVGTPYTSALLGTNPEELLYRFTCPATCILERAMIHGNLTCTADLQIVLTKASDASTPAGATVPYLSTKGAVTNALLDTTDVNVDRVLLAANTEYIFAVSGGGTFTLNRFDLVLHIATDRWTPAGTVTLPDFQPTLLADGGIPAATVNTNNTNLTTEVAKLASSKIAAAFFPMLFVIHGLVTGTSANIRTFMVPRFDPARAKCLAQKLYLSAYTAGAAIQISATLTGVTALTVTPATVVTGGFRDTASSTIAKSLENVAGDPAITANDLTMTLASNSATSCIKAYALLWVARA